MPKHEIHERKKSKNYAVMAIIAVVMVMFFALTIVKFVENKNNAVIQSEK